jgi:hypothetical protein
VKLSAWLSALQWAHPMVQLWALPSVLQSVPLSVQESGQWLGLASACTHAAPIDLSLHC